ncbi:hypothetical protein [Gracilinema caldarium]|uniref:Uncharacterized protein n=1 Tax=Gracilinema caldarium (strain ATCC 51460 / DSM 7334 / H1) TaxID=744872 RepID=F8F2Y2_GRAC1|nr:hypothetical protein [Gracilinema caldarium]AEJ19890.1 hypothetical protein Spica_1748 [Gracilinema caldarium DSM 7334]
MDLEQCILEIVNSFTKGDYFDSHTVINTLIAKPEYHLAYLRGYTQNSSVAQYHGNIAKMIGATNLVDQLGTAKSHTIYGDLSANMLWQKK